MAWVVGVKEAEGRHGGTRADMGYQGRHWVPRQTWGTRADTGVCPYLGTMWPHAHGILGIGGDAGTYGGSEFWHYLGEGL